MERGDGLLLRLLRHGDTNGLGRQRLAQRVYPLLRAYQKSVLADPRNALLPPEVERENGGEAKHHANHKGWIHKGKLRKGDSRSVQNTDFPRSSRLNLESQLSGKLYLGLLRHLVDSENIAAVVEHPVRAGSFKFFLTETALPASRKVLPGNPSLDQHQLSAEETRQAVVREVLIQTRDATS